VRGASRPRSANASGAVRSPAFRRHGHLRAFQHPGSL